MPRPTRAAAVLVLALASASPAVAGERPSCAGRLSGEAKARFVCTALLGAQADGRLVFAITIPGPVDGIPSLVPGAFEVPGPAEARTYTLDELGMGKAAVAVEGGALYTAAKTSSQRGEVRLELRSVRRSARSPGAYEVHGTYRARLLPAGGGRSGDVVVDVKF